MVERYSERWILMSAAIYQCHVLIIQDDRGLREIILDHSSYTIGRDPSCEVLLASQFVSRRHATLVKLFNQDGTFYYRIMDGTPAGKPSANGLRINGHKLPAHDLQPDDHVVFGPNVSAHYVLLKQDVIPTAPLSEFDLALINRYSRIEQGIEISTETLPVI